MSVGFSKVRPSSSAMPVRSIRELASTGWEWIERIRQAVASGDCAEVEAAAHCLKGAAAILCAERLHAIAARIERAGTSDDIQTAEAQLEVLADEMRRCLDHIPQLQQSLKTNTNAYPDTRVGQHNTVN